MKQNKMTKVMALMLSFVMITSVFVGNTLSRYVTSVSSTDSARVAIWGINGGTTTMELFNTAYDLDGKKIAEANLNEDGTTRDKIIAPGTGGSSAFSIINFENEEIPPEVAYQVTINLDDSQVDEKIVNNTSIQWKLDNNAWGTFDELKTSLLSLSGHESGSFNYMPGTFADAFKGNVEHKIYWQWALDGNNEVDTQMGNDALDSDIGVKISVTITAQQTDDLVTNENLLDGANQVVNLNDVQTLTLRSASDIGNFQRVEVNNQTVDPSNYTTESGSTIVKLKKEYLETLAAGSYTINIVSTDMVASTRFIVKEAPIVHNGVIPEGAVYYSSFKKYDEFLDGLEEDIGLSNNIVNTDFSGFFDNKHISGEFFPEIVKDGDIYVYGDYIYMYNVSLNPGFNYRHANNMRDYLEGWSVLAIDRTRSSYGEILTSINNKDIVNLSATFAFNNNLKESPKLPITVKYLDFTYYASGLEEAPSISDGVIEMINTFCDCLYLMKAPEIPEGVEDISGAFSNCILLTEAPAIPSSVENIYYAFYGCSNLTGTIVINANFSKKWQYENALKGTQITWIDGSISAESIGNIVLDSGLTLIYNGEDMSKSGIYYTGVTSWETGDYTGAKMIYINGSFPETVSFGDIYVYGDYEYRYDSIYNTDTEESFNGWNVKVLDKSKSEYGEILTEINGEDVVGMNYTFAECSNMVKSPVIPNTIISMSNTFNYCYSLIEAPVIPNGVTNMESTFYNCTSLETAPRIPESVTYMSEAFSGCTSLKTAINIPSKVTSMTAVFAGCSNLTGSIEINANPTSYGGALYDTQITEITGSTTLKNEILATRYE